MRVLVTGGRDYKNKDALSAALRSATFGQDDVTIVHGGARGADALAHQIGTEKGWRVVVSPADWDALGRSAGPMRNQQMIDAGADIVVAAPGGGGTADCVRRAKRAGIPVMEVRE
jgi:ABC-type sugar transport system substrate-binding protein